MTLRATFYATELVPKLLEGEITQTRRPIRKMPKHPVTHVYWSEGSDIFNVGPSWVAENIVETQEGRFDCLHSTKLKTPYKLEDILWVRETWDYTEEGHCIYKADTPESEWPKRWVTPAQFPFVHCRIVLKVVDIWAERLQDIDQEGIEAEGYETLEDFKKGWDRFHCHRKRCKLIPFEDNPWVWVFQLEKIER